MLSKISFTFILLSALYAPQEVLGREKWLERDNRPVYLYPRRFGQERPAVLQKIGAACPGQVCGNLAGQAVTPLLAGQSECSQQDLADAIIDASKQFDAVTRAKMIALAVEYRQVEKNTPPDFTTNPPSLRNSVFCQKAPKNPELNGLVQAQDPANDPNLFFDPATKSTVRKGSQANTSPFRGAGAAESPSVTTAPPTTITPPPVRVADPIVSCPTAITVTISAANTAATGDNAVTVTVSGGIPTPTAAPRPSTTAGSGSIGNFGKCSVPQIEFGVGFDGRKETSFRPVDPASYNHGSAQNIDIITQFICDTLVNSCGADQVARDTCAAATTAAASNPTGTGAQADAFNAVFGINTAFSGIQAVDDQGISVTSNGSGIPSSATKSSATTQKTGLASSPTGQPSANDGIGNFGSCTVPEIEFGAGFGFRPTDGGSFNQGSAQDIGTVARAVCNTLFSCNADQAAKDTCAKAQGAAASAPAGTGAQADAFNAAFGIQTTFASINTNNQGNPDNGSGGSNIVPTNIIPTNLVPTTAIAAAKVTTVPKPIVTTNNPPTAAKIPADSNLQTFTSALGGATAPAVTETADGKFQVEGNSIINDRVDALTRSCDVQNNKCADAANASGNKNGFTVAACTVQQQQCIAAAKA